MNEHDRRHRGVHYTPASVARYLAQCALGPWLADGATDVPAELTLLDAACGDGALLAAASEVFADEMRAKTPPRSLRLVGLDISSDAVETARARLAARPRPGVTWTLGVGDALADHPLLDRPFDVVLGNPPYVFGEHLGALDRASLAARYELARRRQPDLYKLFYERTLALLGETGRHAFVVPDAMLTRDEHQDVRSLVTKHLQVEHVCQLGAVFDSAGGVAPIVVAGARRSSSTEVAVDTWNSDHVVRSHAVPRAWLTPSDGSPWSVDAPPSWFGPLGLRTRLERAGQSLGELLAPGPLGLTRGEELGKSSLLRLSAETWTNWRQAIDDERTPIYAGESVHRHRLALPTRETRRTAVLKNPRFYSSPKILFVKTGAGPVAATCNDEIPALQSVYTLHLAPSVRERIREDAIVAVLCSALLATYCWHRWTSGKRVQPQLTLDNVRSLPMPDEQTLVSASDELAGAVDQIRSALTTGAEVAALERALDGRIAELFGLKLEDWTPLVEASLARLPPSQRSRWLAPTG